MPASDETTGASEDTRPDPQREDPQQQRGGFLGTLDSVSFLMFLVHPDQRPLSEFGEVPAQWRNLAYRGAQMAESFGLDADINGDVSAMTASLTPTQLMDILRNMDQEAFVTTHRDHAEVRGMVQDMSVELIAQARQTMTVTEAAAFIGEENIAFNASLAALPLSAVLDGSDEFRTIVTNMGDTQVLNLLNSLPEGMQNDILAQLGSHPRENNSDPLVAIEGLDLSGLDIEQAIAARAEHEESQGFAGLFNWSSNASAGSIHGVYDVIRASLVTDLPTEMNVRLGGDPEQPIDIDPERLYVMLQEELAEEGGGRVGNLLTTDFMDRIRERLNAIEDHSFLVNLLPQHMQDEGIFNAIRAQLAQHGLLGPAGGIVMQLAGILVNAVASYGPNLIGQDRTDQLVAQMEDYISPGTARQEPVDPDALIAEVNQGPVPAGGTPAVIATG